MHVRQSRLRLELNAAPKALSQVPKADFPSWSYPRTPVVKSFAAVALQLEALPKVPISRALCTVDAPLSLDLEGSEVFASSWELLRRT